MSKKKTSFKELLSKGASNPRVNVQNVRDQRQRLDTLKRSAQPAAASAQPPPAKRVASSSDAPALPAPKTSAAAGGQPAFVYAPTFAGLRPGYAFKSGPQGVGFASRARTRALTLTLTLTLSLSLTLTVSLSLTRYYLEGGAGAAAAVPAEEELARAEADTCAPAPVTYAQAARASLPRTVRTSGAGELGPGPHALYVRGSRTSIEARARTRAVFGAWFCGSVLRTTHHTRFTHRHTADTFNS